MAHGDENRHDPVPSDAPIDYDRVADVYDLYVTSTLDVGFYVEEAGKVQRKVLGLMCGTGRVSISLLEAGVDLTCVDASEGMLARLKERLRARRLKARVVRADVRHLKLARGGGVRVGAHPLPLVLRVGLTARPGARVESHTP
jgi:hypothetical protein